MLKNFSKENVTLGFYVIYIFIAGICYEIFPGDAKTPNIGVLLLWLFIPISIIYFTYHIIRHLFLNINHLTCLIIHGVVWISIYVVLTNFKT